MGGSAKWIKSLVGLKKSEKDHNHREGKKWKLWRNSSESRSRQSEATSETASVTAKADPLAALVRAPPRDFETVQKEWAAVRIQSAFRSFLARRALKALKGIVRIQALVRGRRVRKDLAVTYKCMQALVRVQEKFRQRRLDASSDSSQLENNLTDPVKLAEDGWCDKQGSIDEIKAKIKMRHEGAIKRERALSYASSQKQQLRVMTPNRKSSSLKDQEIDFSKPNSFQIRRNNISTRISLNPPAKDNVSFSDFYERSPSSSSPVGFNFMSLTESTKAKMSENKKTALKNVKYEKNESGSHMSVSGNNKSGFRLMRCDNNKENWSFESRMSPFA